MLPCPTSTLPDPGLHQHRRSSRRVPYFKYGLRLWDAGGAAAQPAPVRRPNPEAGADPSGCAARAGPPLALGKRARAADLAECAGAAGRACKGGGSGGAGEGDRAAGESARIGEGARRDEPRRGAPPPAKRAQVGDRGARSATPKPKRPSQELWRPRTRTAIGAHGALAPGSRSPERLLGARARAGGAVHGACASPAGSPLAYASPGRAAGPAAAALRDGQRVTEMQAREARARGGFGGGSGSTSGVEVRMREGPPNGVSAGGGSPPRSPSPAATTPGRATGLTGACGVPHSATKHVKEGHAWGVSLAGGSAPSCPAPASGHPPQGRPALARVGNGAAGSAGAAADLARLAGGFAEGLAAAGSAALLEALAQKLLSRQDPVAMTCLPDTKALALWVRPMVADLSSGF